jgi:glucose/arabinose dehydrogenase
VTRAWRARSALLLAGLVLSGAALAGPWAQKPVAATLVDFKIRLSRPAVSPGKVVFQVVNNGAVGHDLVFVGAGGKRTRVLRPKQKQTLAVTFSKPGVYRFYCSVAGHRALGMQGTIRVGKAEPSPQPDVGTGRTQIRTDELRLTQVATGLAPITGVLSPPGDPSRLLVVEQDGLVSLLKDGVRQTSPFLDLRDVTRANGEGGLLSVAFAPDYPASGLLYADYNDLAGSLRLVAFHRSTGDSDRVDPDGHELLRVAKPTVNHNGGMLQFGPDGYLYVAVGDGGADPPTVAVGAYGQTLDDLLGSILRIDPRHGAPYAIPPANPFGASGTFGNASGARPEIVAYGLRNPWRFWIDPQTSQMLIGDVGEGTREEVDRLPLDRLGLDFGWPCKEGTTTPPSEIDKPASCANAQLVPPIYEYPHAASRCSITGGVVARDPRLPDLNGLYLWSDLCDGQLYAIDPNAPAITATPLALTVSQPTTFGVDAEQRIYVGTAAGALYRLDPN